LEPPEDVGSEAIKICQVLKSKIEKNGGSYLRHGSKAHNVVAQASEEWRDLCTPTSNCFVTPPLLTL